MQVDNRVVVSLKQMMSKKGYIDVPSHGFSMYPLIRTGYVCRFVPAEPGELKKGDIVLFAAPNRTMVGHRYYGTRTIGTERFYLFKGDSNPSFDPPIRGDQVMGRMVWIRKPGRTRRTDSIAMKAWAALLVRFPSATKLVHYMLRLSRRRETSMGL